MKRSVRGIAFVVAVLAHVALVALLTTSAARRNTGETAEAPRMVVVFIDPEKDRATHPTLQSSTPTLPFSAPRVELPRIESSGSITVAPDVPSPAEAPESRPSIDWRREGQSAAARLAESLETERRRKGRFAPDPRFARPAPRPQFGWDQSKTHRVESLPGGGTLIHLNDRCVIALTGFLIPMCKLGKIEARGDLFEHMGDAPASDDEP